MDPYKILGVAKTSTRDQIRAKYKELVRIHHPDKNRNKDSGIFENIKRAYDTIINNSENDVEVSDSYDFISEIKSKCKTTAPETPQIPKLSIDKINKMKKAELIEVCNRFNLHVDTKSTKTNLIEVIVTFLIPKDDHELLKEARKMHTAYLAKLDEYESGLLNGEVLPFPEF